MNVEEVFKIGGVPTVTFVEPKEYADLTVALRTPGRGVIIEGPSGIGKTTAVNRALGALGLKDKSLFLSARKKGDIEIIRALPEIQDAGVVIVDDFHRLEDEDKHGIADYIKVLADEENKQTKIVVVGINKCGKSLIKFAEDVTNRVSIIGFENNPDEKVVELIGKGEQALVVKDTKFLIAVGAQYFLIELSQLRLCVLRAIQVHF